MKIYLAGPIGHKTYKDANGWREEAAAKMAEMGHEAVTPLRGKHVYIGQAQAAEAKQLANAAGITPRQIVTRDLADVWASDFLLANLLDVRANNEIPVGTCMEIFYAAHVMHLPVVTVTNELESPWLHHYSIRVVDTLEAAYEVIRQYGG